MDSHPDSPDSMPGDQLTAELLNSVREKRRRILINDVVNHRRTPDDDELAAGKNNNNDVDFVLMDDDHQENGDDEVCLLSHFNKLLFINLIMDYIFRML